MPSSRKPPGVAKDDRCSGGGAIPTSDQNLIDAANEIADLPGFNEILDSHGIKIKRDRSHFEVLAEYPAEPPPTESGSRYRKK